MVKYRMKYWVVAILVLVLSVVLFCPGCSSNSGQTTGGITYIATLGKIKVTLSIPAQINSFTTLLNHAGQVATGKPTISYEPFGLSSYTIENNSSQPTLGAGYWFVVTLADGQRPDFIDVATLEQSLMSNLDPSFQNKALSAYGQLLKATVVEPGSMGTLYCFFHTNGTPFAGVTTPGIRSVTVSSVRPHYGPTLMKKD